MIGSTLRDWSGFFQVSFSLLPIEGSVRPSGGSSQRNIGNRLTCLGDGGKGGCAGKGRGAAGDLKVDIRRRGVLPLAHGDACHVIADLCGSAGYLFPTAVEDRIGDSDVVRRHFRPIFRLRKGCSLFRTVIGGIFGRVDGHSSFVVGVTCCIPIIADGLDGVITEHRITIDPVVGVRFTPVLRGEPDNIVFAVSDLKVRIVRMEINAVINFAIACDVNRGSELFWRCFCAHTDFCVYGQTVNSDCLTAVQPEVACLAVCRVVCDDGRAVELHCPLIKIHTPAVGTARVTIPCNAAAVHGENLGRRIVLTATIKHIDTASVPGDCAVIHIEIASHKPNTEAAAGGIGGMLDRARFASTAIGQIQRASAAVAVRDLEYRGVITFHRDCVTVQAEGDLAALHHNVGVERNIIIQVIAAVAKIVAVLLEHVLVFGKLFAVDAQCGVLHGQYFIEDHIGVRRSVRTARTADGVSVISVICQHRHAAKLHRHGEGRCIRCQPIALWQYCMKSIAAGIGSLSRIIVTAPAIQGKGFCAVLCSGFDFYREQIHDILIGDRTFRTGGQGKYTAFRVKDILYIHPAPCRDLGHAAQGADIGAGLSLHSRCIPTLLVMFMLAVQLLLDTAAFLAAYMAARGRLCRLGGCCLRSFRILRGCRPVLRNAAVLCRVAVRGMFVGAACDLMIAFLTVLVGAGAFLGSLHIPTGFIMLRVVRTQTTCDDGCTAVLCCQS